MEPKIAQARKDLIEKARAESLDNALAVIKQKYKEIYEAEKAAAKAEKGKNT